MTHVIHQGDCRAILATLPEASVQCVVTSPPYWGLRDYGCAGQLGLEPLHDCLGWARGERCAACFVCHMVEVFEAVRRVLADDGVCWVNLGDSYSSGGRQTRDPVQSKLHPAFTGEDNATTTCRPNPPGVKPKDLMMMPARVALALQAWGWYLRQDVIWHKPNPMPESVTDRCTKAHEYLFLLTKSARYYWDKTAIAESVKPERSGNKERKPASARGVPVDAGGSSNGGVAGSVPWQSDTRNKRSVWTVPTAPFTEWAETVRLVRVSSDAPADDTMRITSLGCPSHAGQPDLVPNAFCDERAADETTRTLHTHGRPVRVQHGVLAPTAQHHACWTVRENSGLQILESSPAAMLRSIGTRKTGLDQSTSPACIACAESPDHTACRLASHEIGVPSDHTPESRSGQDGSACHPSAETGLHSVRSSSCNCAFYALKTEKTSHFATFPPDLIRPCILAGSREGDTVLDPFNGAGTTGLVALEHGRRYIGCELNPEYIAMAERRLGNVQTRLAV